MYYLYSLRKPKKEKKGRPMISVSRFPTSYKYNSFHIAAETIEEKKQRLKDYGEKQKEAREKDLEKLNESPLRFYDTINLFLTGQQDEKYIAYAR